MALVRNIAGVPKLGVVSPDMDMQKMIEADYGGGSYYDPVYPQVPLVDSGPVYQGPMSKDYGGGGGLPMPENFYGPDDTASEPGPSDQQPVYPILPIRGLEELPVETPEVVNTVTLEPAGSLLQGADLAALGVLGGILFMSLAGRPKGALGGIAYAGALGVLYLRLRNVRVVQVQPVTE